MDLRTLIVALVAVSAAATRPHNLKEAIEQWPMHAYNMFRNSVRYTSIEEVSERFGLFDLNMTHRLSIMGSHKYRVFVAAADHNEPLSVVFPDKLMSVSGLHGVVLLDPFPHARFGHPVLIFFVEKVPSEVACYRDLDGYYFPKAGLCLHVTHKNRCYSKYRGVQDARKCAINFIPMVHGREVCKQKLICREKVTDFFAKCTELRNIEETNRVDCDPIRSNTQLCNLTKEAEKTSCNRLQRCDHAIILSGGWNHQLSNVQSLKNVKDMTRMFDRNGFGENIRIFYANGRPREGNIPRMYPSIMKSSFRKHLRTLCETRMCVDTLVIYLNSPALSDGTSLLWDIDRNGIMSPDEAFTVDEMMSSLQNCVAERVVLLVDQSYAGKFISAAYKYAETTPNVMIFTSASEWHAAWSNDFTTHWSSMAKGTECLHNIYNISHYENINPHLMDTRSGESTRITLTGGQCIYRNQFHRSDADVKKMSIGCENLTSRDILNLARFKNF